METILDLCGKLPDSEPELRERVGEFNALLSELVCQKPALGQATVTRIDGDADVWVGEFPTFGVQENVRLRECHCHIFNRAGDDRIFGHSTHCLEPVPDYANSITDAKAATDAMTSKWSVDIFSPRDDIWSVRAHLYFSDLPDVEVFASTEELARAAACLLAAAAMAKGKE